MCQLLSHSQRESSNAARVAHVCIFLYDYFVLSSVLGGGRVWNALEVVVNNRIVLGLRLVSQLPARIATGAR